MKDKVKFIASIIIFVTIAFYIGAMFNFFPFIADDLTICAIGYCTLIICTTIAICTCILKK